MSKWGNWHKRTALFPERWRVKAGFNTGSSFRIIGLELTFWVFFFCVGGSPSYIKNFLVLSTRCSLAFIYIISLLLLFLKSLSGTLGVYYVEILLSKSPRHLYIKHKARMAKPRDTGSAQWAFVRCKMSTRGLSECWSNTRVSVD